MQGVLVVTATLFIIIMDFLPLVIDQFRQIVKISEICSEIEFLWGKSISSFGKVIEVQIAIATINGILSIIGLWLMSSKAKLPIFYTLSILIVSEHVAGVLGLIIEIPIFMFILDVIEVSYINTIIKKDDR